MSFCGDWDFMLYAGWRNMVIEEKIEQCLAAARRRESFFDVERGDLTDSEIDYLQKEVERRIKSGSY